MKEQCNTPNGEARLGVHLVADSGFEHLSQHRITLDQWAAINAILNGETGVQSETATCEKCGGKFQPQSFHLPMKLCHGCAASSSHDKLHADTPRTNAHLSHLNLPDGRKVGIPDQTVALLRELERQSAGAVTTEMVDRFLSWKLPDDFRPDAGISFKREYNEGTPYPGKHQPTGTNLLNADQAKAMLEHVLAVVQSAELPLNDYDAMTQWLRRAYPGCRDHYGFQDMLASFEAGASSARSATLARFDGPHLASTLRKIAHHCHDAGLDEDGHKLEDIADEREKAWERAATDSRSAK